MTFIMLTIFQTMLAELLRMCLIQLARYTCRCFICLYWPDLETFVTGNSAPPPPPQGGEHEQLESYGPFLISPDGGFLLDLSILRPSIPSNLIGIADILEAAFDDERNGDNEHQANGEVPHVPIAPVYVDAQVQTASPVKRPNSSSLTLSACSIRSEDSLANSRSSSTSLSSIFDGPGPALNDSPRSTPATSLLANSRSPSVQSAAASVDFAPSTADEILDVGAVVDNCSSYSSSLASRGSDHSPPVSPYGIPAPSLSGNSDHSDEVENLDDSYSPSTSTDRKYSSDEDELNLLAILPQPRQFSRAVTTGDDEVKNANIHQNRRINPHHPRDIARQRHESAFLEDRNHSSVTEQSNRRRSDYQHVRHNNIEGVIGGRNSQPISAGTPGHKKSSSMDRLKRSFSVIMKAMTPSKGKDSDDAQSEDSSEDSPPVSPKSK